MWATASVAHIISFPDVVFPKKGFLVTRATHLFLGFNDFPSLWKELLQVGEGRRAPTTTPGGAATPDDVLTVPHRGRPSL